jgi:hypothetical protein
LKATDYVAIYAAVLSTLVFVWNIRNSWPRVIVELIWGIQEREPGVYIYIKNPSKQAVNIHAVWFLVPFRRVTITDRLKHVWRFRRLPRYMDWVHTDLSFCDITTGLPTSIAPRTSHHIFIQEEKIREILKRNGSTRFAAGVQDALSRNKYSAPFKMF